LSSFNFLVEVGVMQVFDLLGLEHVVQRDPVVGVFRLKNKI
jgi:hypothetical protein